MRVLAVNDGSMDLLDALWQLWSNLPFTPFRVVMTTGTVHRIDSQAALSWRRDQPIWAGIKQSDGTWAVVDTSEIAAIVIESESPDGQ